MLCHFIICRINVILDSTLHSIVVQKIGIVISLGVFLSHLQIRYQSTMADYRKFGRTMVSGSLEISNISPAN